MAGLGKNFDVELRVVSLGCGVDVGSEFGQMDHLGTCRVSAKLAVEIPEIHTFGQGTAALTLDVFADFMFGCLEQALGVLAVQLQGECFFHGDMSFSGDDTSHMQNVSQPHRSTPGKEAIALLPVFERLGMERITLVSTGAQARQASEQLMRARAWGFDTESKPTFRVGEQSDGPHIVQLSTLERAWVFQLHEPECRALTAQLLACEGVVKAGFGLGDDRKRILSKLGVEPAGVLELNTVFQQQGYRKDMGVKGAVAVLFAQRFMKSKKAATSNWANARLTEAQLVYAANDAFAAMRVYAALGLD